MWTFEQMQPWGATAPFPVAVMETVDSTSAWLHRLKPAAPRGIIAYRQTAGYGQQGRRWCMRPGRDLVFSCWLPFEGDRQALPALTPWLAFHLRAALQPFSDQRLMCKWPNDLYTDAGKVSGTLVEVCGEGLIIGTGINWLAGASTYAALQETAPAPEQVARQVGGFLQSWLSWLAQSVPGFGLSAWEAVQPDWAAHDWFRPGTWVMDRETERPYRYLGVDERGCLHLRDPAGQDHVVHSGRISLIRLREG